ncbi:hypothetical protein G5B40_10875 [Pikeienuella piscinae]|uniref:Uncharacterized protein n=1 Tax=Pikeienuella piscinae TaxID=2748098 RepID=A0A7L5BYJ1_9RHOB|nr:hypothetical protein [Pikeienuella piscinae]QIE55908.1 hypothetical protein G5B40_10875 [Pikeienuella piscinae]
MNLEEFETALARHGAAFSDWPGAAREAAEALLATSGAARRAHEEMAALAAALSAARAAPPDAPEALIERVITDAADVAAERARGVQRRARPSPLDILGRAFSTPLLRPVVACAASAAFGLWLGQTGLMAGAAESLIDIETGAGDRYAFDIGDDAGDPVYAFLSDSEVWR